MKNKFMKGFVAIFALAVSGVASAGIIDLTTRQVVLDGSGKIWDFTSNCYSQGGLSVGNGTIDAYDCGVILSVNGTAFSATTGDLTANTLTTSGSIGGFNIIREDYVSTTDPFLRTLFTLTNSTSSSLDLDLLYQTNTGADNSQQVLTTSSGDQNFSVNDGWVTTDDFSLVGNDPTLNHILHGGSYLPTYVDLGVFSAAGTQGVEALFDYSFDAGETISFLFFNQQFTTSSEAASDVVKFNSSSSLLDSGYLNGLSNSQLANVANWEFEVPEPPTLAVFALGLMGLASRKFKKQA